MNAFRRRPRALAGGAALLATFPAAFLLRDRIEASRFTVCAFRAWTDRPCLFCGLTHAFGRAMHADWRGASEAHRLWPLAAAIVAGAGLILLSDGFLGSNRSGSLAPSRRSGWILVLIVVAGSIARATLTPPS